MTPYNSKYFFGFAALAFVTTANALAVTPSNDATALAKALLGPGITLVSATYSGAPEAAGFYTGGPQGIRDSVVLTSGNAVDVVPGPNTSDEISKNNGTPGSLLCQSLNGGVDTYDAAVLSMNVILEPAFTGVFSEFVFTTEEFPEWTNSDFNDVFGIFVGNNQIALDASGAPITINGPFFGNGSVLTPPSSGSSMGGSTPLLISGYTTTPGAHTIDIAICDTSDSLLDSAVFIALSAYTDEYSSGTVISPCAGRGGDSDNDGICDDTDNCPLIPNLDQNQSACMDPTDPTISIISGPTDSTVTITPDPTNSTTSIIADPTNSASSSTAPVISSSGSEDNISKIPTSATSSFHLTPPYSNHTVTAASIETETETPSCVTFTSMTITTCSHKTTFYPTTTVSPSVIISTLQLTVDTPCSAVTVSKCAGGPGSPCVTYTNIVAYTVTGYPLGLVPTFIAPAPTIPHDKSTHECPGGVNCPHPTPSPSISTPAVTDHTTGTLCPDGPCSSPTASTVTLPHTSAAPVCPGSPNCPPAAPSSIMAKPSASVCPGGADCPTTSKNVEASTPTSTPVAVFTGAASRMSGTEFAAVIGVVVAFAVAL